MLHILMLAFIDHIEKRGETVAQIEVTAAAMTNIENPAQLCVQRFLVIETFILPRDRVADRCPKATFLNSVLSCLFMPDRQARRAFSRSKERRVGKECVGKGRSRGWPYQ